MLRSLSNGLQNIVLEKLDSTGRKDLRSLQHIKDPIIVPRIIKLLEKRPKERASSNGFGIAFWDIMSNVQATKN